MGSVTSFVLYPTQVEKLEHLAAQLGQNRSVVLRTLIEQAAIISRPEMSVPPLKENDAQPASQSVVFAN